MQTTPHRGAGESKGRPKKATAIFKIGRVMSRAAVESAARALCGGGVAVFPTDTVYGLGAHVFRPGAVRRIYSLKGRSYDKPLPLLVADLPMAEALVQPLSLKLRRLLRDYWPGPLTVVFKTSSLGQWVMGGKPTVAVRIPRHAAALALLKAVKCPLAVTSANASGNEPAVTGKQALGLFKGKVDVLLNAGRCPKGRASTVLDASHEPWTLVREGAVKKDELLKYMSG